ncbi:MAG: ATPase [Clostridia bacterium]|nr:ATPase [Oscillospiraceae bacterium]MBQ7033353.1 ATPase [Clostridia bacterium]
MEIFDVIDQLEDLIESSFTWPILHKTMIDKEDFMELISDIRLRLPEDLKKAKWVTEQRTQIMEEAHKEAADIIRGAEEQKQQLVNEHEITKKAYDQANEVLANAQKNAREIRLGARQYADDVLAGIESRLGNLATEIHAGREELRK